MRIFFGPVQLCCDICLRRVELPQQGWNHDPLESPVAPGRRVTLQQLVTMPEGWRFVGGAAVCERHDITDRAGREADAAGAATAGGAAEALPPLDIRTHVGAGR